MINTSMKLKDFALEKMVSNLLDMCRTELDLTELPDIQLISDESAIGGGTSFGEFSDDGIRVVTTDRHPMDVMRTLAHELVHWKQRTDNRDMNGADGSDIENEANALAGVIMRRFGKKHPECFTI